MDNIIYEGFFIIDELHGNLEKDIQFKHITTEFRPKVTHEHLYGTKAGFVISGYANDGNNEGLYISKMTSSDKELEDLFDNVEVPHITLSVSTVGKPVNTAKLNFSQLNPEDYYMVCGKFGGFNGKEVVFDKEVK